MFPLVEVELGALSAEFGTNFCGCATPYGFCFGVFKGYKLTWVTGVRLLLFGYLDLFTRLIAASWLCFGVPTYYDADEAVVII